MMYRTLLTAMAVCLLSVSSAYAMLAADFGDAPAIYGTLAADDGARHYWSDSGIFLGNSIDWEGDGQPDSLAAGDDLADDDEDGIFFPSPLIRGQAAQVDVRVTNETDTSIYLNAWVDFNQNLTWDLTEQIFSDQTVVNGLNSLVFSIPDTAAIADTYARFRLSSVAGLGFLGHADDGEVEDYRVTIQGSSVPVPSSILLLGFGLMGLLGMGRHRGL